MYSDIIYYQQIGIQSVLAQKQNTSFHEYLFQKMKHKTEKNSNIPEYKKYFEYPPLVVAWFNLPNHFIDFLIFILVFNIGNKFLQVRNIHLFFQVLFTLFPAIYYLIFYMTD